MTDTQYSQFELLPLGLPLGADIRGLDLSRDFDQGTSDALRDALDTYAVLRFRDTGLSEDDHIRLMSVFGPVTVLTNGNRSSLVSNKEKIGVVPHGRLPFHVDLGWTPTPTEVTSLYAIELELPNEPTLFASASAAYSALDESVRLQIAGLTASNVPDASAFRGTGEDPTLLRVSYAVTERTRYPVVMPHPRTGRPILTVSEMLTSEIDGYSVSASEALLGTLFTQLYQPGNVFTQAWQPRDLVVWDNRSAQHGRPNVKATGNRRTLRKVNTGGAMPKYIGRLRPRPRAPGDGHHGRRSRAAVPYRDTAAGAGRTAPAPGGVPLAGRGRRDPGRRRDHRSGDAGAGRALAGRLSTGAPRKPTSTGFHRSSPMSTGSGCTPCTALRPAMAPGRWCSCTAGRARSLSSAG